MQYVEHFVRISENYSNNSNKNNNSENLKDNNITRIKESGSKQGDTQQTDES